MKKRLLSGLLVLMMLLTMLPLSVLADEAEQPIAGQEPVLQAPTEEVLYELFKEKVQIICAEGHEWKNWYLLTGCYEVRLLENACEVEFLAEAYAKYLDAVLVNLEGPFHKAAGENPVVTLTWSEENGWTLPADFEAVTVEIICSEELPEEPKPEEPKPDPKPDPEKPEEVYELVIEPVYYDENGEEILDGFMTYWDYVVEGAGAYKAGEVVELTVKQVPTAPKGYDFVFVGWVNDEVGASMAFEKSDREYGATGIMPAEDTVIYVQFQLVAEEHHIHSVTYTDGVRGEVIFQDTTYWVEEGDWTPKFEVPYRPGYRFVGWSPAWGARVWECVTYVAQWEKGAVPVLNTWDHIAYLEGDGDGTVRPEDDITRAEVAAIFYRLLTKQSREYFYTAENAFTDVNKGDWYNEAVSTLANAGILNGYSNGKFKPNAFITRAEFAALISRFTEVVYNGSCSFYDVSKRHWAAEEIALDEYMGWVEGYEDGTFRPENNITRAEAAAMINRMLGRSCRWVEDRNNWTDNAPGAWYYAHIVEASNTH